MGNSRTFLTLGAVLLGLAVGDASGQRPNDLGAFFVRCEKRTIIMGRNEKGELVKSGERLDSYCEGFLMGSYNSLVNARVLCQKDGEVPSAELLLSIAKTYWADHKTELDLAALVANALKRVYSCTK